MTKNIQRPRISRCCCSHEFRIILVFTAFVFPLLAQSTTNELPPLAPAHGEIQPTFWEQHGTAMLVVGFVFIALAGVIIWLLTRPKPPVMVAPEILARQALEKLRTQPETGNVLSEISQTLRRYIITALGLPHGELTTVEFSAAIMGNRTIGTDLAQAISSFLRDCDDRKFSTAKSGPPLDAAARALQLLEQAEQRRRLGSGPDRGATSAEIQ